MDVLNSFWGTWIAPFLGLAEVGLLLAAVHITISQFSRGRASSYIERFNGHDALASRVAVDEWLAEHRSPRERLDELQRNPELRTHLRRFANLFQELGAAYQFRVAHRRTVRVLFDALVIMYWERLRFWVEEYRAHADATLYARFEYLYDEMKEHERGRATRVDYLLAYGSLMDPASLTAGLGRETSLADLIPVDVVGWERRWSVGEEVRVEGENEVTVAAFLDLVAQGGAQTRAAIVRITPDELRRLATREKNYSAKDLSEDVRLSGGRRMARDASVWGFTGSSAHLTGPPTGTANSQAVRPVLLGAYLSRVARAAGQLDTGLDRQIRSSASDSGLQVVDGPYAFVDAAQAELV